MPHAHASSSQAFAPAPQSARRGSLLLAVLGAAVLGPAGVAAAAPSVPDGFTITTFAPVPVSTPVTVGADDITRLDGHDFVGFNNSVPKTGPAATGPQNSTVVQYNDDGTIANTFSVRGRVDGLGADAANHRVIVTTNEDGNSTIHTLQPSAVTPVVDYTYSPNPSASADTTHDNTLQTGGGTDAVQVINGKIYLAASNPNDLTAAANPNPKATATFQVTLSQSAGVNTATLTPTFADDATASVGGGASGTTTLALTDPDSNAAVPFFASLYGGDYVLDSQADQQLIFVNGIDSASSFGPSNLTQLPLTHDDPSKPASTLGAGVDDIRWSEGDSGSLIVVDGKSNIVYKITGPFSAFQAFAALDTLGANANTTEVDALDSATGKLKPFATGFGTAKGLLWVPNSRSEGPQSPPDQDEQGDNGGGNAGGGGDGAGGGDHHGGHGGHHPHKPIKAHHHARKTSKHRHHHRHSPRHARHHG
jgi:hypothetical protein